MSGIERPQVYGYNPESKKVFIKKEKSEEGNGSSEEIKYSRFKYDQRTDEVKKVKDKTPVPEKMSKDTKLRLVGVLLATLTAGTAGYEGVKTATDYKPADGEKKTVQANTIQPPKAPFVYYVENDHQTSKQEVQKSPVPDTPVQAATTGKAASNKLDTTIKKIENIFHHEARSIDQMFDYHHKGKFHNADKMEAELKQYWLEWYENHPDRLQGLLSGHYEYTAWEPHILQRLKQKNIGDEELWNSMKYFALTESDFTNKKPSKANAVGPFQIMKGTGISKPCNLTINKIIDPRRDPLEGAEAAARLIQDDRERLGEKNRPIEMAKYVYNAPYGSCALTQAKAEHAEFNTNYFMHFMENDMNIIKDIAHEGRWDVYRTKKNERLDDIFARFKKAGKITNEAEFYCLNRLVSRNKKLKGGIKITLPLVIGINRSEKAKEAFYKTKTIGRFENMGYGPRMGAIKAHIIKSGALNRRKEPIKFREIMTTATKAVPVKKIVERYGLTHKEFKKINEKIVGSIVPPNTAVRLPQG